MAKRRTCPACHKEIPGSGAVCPLCNAELEVLIWEVEMSAGPALAFRGVGAVRAIKEKLLSGEIRLSDSTSQRVEALASVGRDQGSFVVKRNRPTKSLRHYASRHFELQVLFAPAKAYAKRCAWITWIVVGVCTAVAWNAYGLVLLGSHPVTATFVGALMLVSLPTVFLAVPVFVVAQRAYDVAVMALTLRTFFSYVYGAMVGAVVGWTIGYMIGLVYGATKKPTLIEREHLSSTSV
jgi:hypothetical protein